FSVDSFFDITYQIEFEGSPGSILEGLAGTTTHTDHFHAGAPYVEPIDHNCQLPDNGRGTIDLPPDCPNGYVGRLSIIDGLPAGTTITGEAVLRDISVTAQGIGGTLGGEFQEFDALVYWQATGTGDMTGFERLIIIPVLCEVHTGPRSLGEPVQTFANELISMQGQLYGDPDFCDLILSAGTSYGMPGPGSTTLTKLPSENFAVDSFFDITYQIDFEGCPGSVIEGVSGSTLDTKQFRAGEEYLVSGVGDSVTTPLGVLYQNAPNPFNPSTWIPFELARSGHVRLTIYNLAGQKVRTLLDKELAAGIGYTTFWDGKDEGGRDAASGVYVAEMTGGEGAFRQTMKMTLVR
ncbi:MAG: hypothetical protein KAJ05_07040, partial [Candidatus Latescibacteria bacterium]|nr:hypothetical protein [Candidatus Latescibacterota bacterium]